MIKQSDFCGFAVVAGKKGVHCDIGTVTAVKTQTDRLVFILRSCQVGEADDHDSVFVKL